MKKVIITVLCVFAFITANAQKIVYDKIENSTRIIATDWFSMWKKGILDTKSICQSIDAKLIACIDEEKVVYMICTDVNYPILFVSERQIPSDGKLLLRAKDEHVMELTTLMSADSQYQVQNVDVVTIQDNTMITEGKSFIKGNSRNIMGIYPISEQDLLSLSSGVAKVRIEMIPKHFDFEFKKGEKFSGRIISAYNMIKNRIEDKDKKALYEGF